MQQIQQLCRHIASHPSQINQLNQAVTIALTNADSQLIAPILELIGSMKKEQNIRKFLDNKLKAIFGALLTRQDAGSMQLLEKCYELSGEQKQLTGMFLEYARQEEEIDWEAGWPASLLSVLFQILSEEVQTKAEEVQWQFVLNLVLKLPDFSELEVSIDLEPTFKKNYQKLLLSLLASSHCPEQQLIELYQHLGNKVLSKMSQPLALSNHCLSRFAQNPEVQISILSCLFLLVGKYGLELEEFYPKLETLIKYRGKSGSVYELPNSRKFFKLLEAALRSSRVPFKTVHSFVEIMVKQIAGQTGEFAFWTLSFIINLSKKHRKLMDYLPHSPEIRSLKYHYNGKVRALVNELFKNLSRIDYLQLQDFTKLNLKALSEKKINSAINSLDNDELEFKVPMYFEQL